jgi:hypothetical protein
MLFGTVSFTRALLPMGLRPSSRRRFDVVTAGALALIGALLIAGPLAADLDRVSVAPVWSGHPVNFAIETVGGRQYVAFYDSERRMTVAQRSLESSEWSFQRLPSVLEWDSHSDVVMAVDSAGFIHVSGNMHRQRLVYFRSVRPHDISVFVQPGMVESLEKWVTYPVFLRGADDRLFFQYRYGTSGKGVQILNAYETERQSWTRLISKPLFDGVGKQSAYLAGPTIGPDGAFHLVWMWRDTPNGGTNHDISYARSRNLVEWESAAGVPLALPIRPSAKEAVVDAVRAGEGLAGIAFAAGWDSRHKPMVTYSKYDAAGRSQSYTARFDGEWKIHQVSDWEFRWDLARTGTLSETISVRPPRLDDDGRLVQEFRHDVHGSGNWILDEEDLRIVDVEPLPDELRELRIPESDVPGMEVREFIYDRKGEYFLRWETLPVNRDKPREPPYPEPSILSVVRHGSRQAGESSLPSRSRRSSSLP